MPSHQHCGLKLSTLAPIHIGTGQDLQPTEYVIDKGFLYRFDPLTFVSLLPLNERKALEALASQPPKLQGKRAIDEAGKFYTQVQRFIYNHRDTAKLASIAVRPVAGSLESYYLSKLGLGVKDNERSALHIAETLKSPYDHQPLVPGSSLKGALRTALTNALLRHERSPGRTQGKARAVEQSLLGFKQMNEDPLKALKVSDLMPCKALVSQILFGSSVKKEDPSRSNSRLNVTLEVIPPFAVQALQGELRVETCLLSPEQKTRLASILTIRTLFQNLNAFYLPQLREELDRMGQLGMHQGYYLDDRFHWINQVRKLLSAVGPDLENGNAALLRLGHYAGAESKSWDGLREIKIMQGKNKAARYGITSTTFWLAGLERKSVSRSLPFGWALLERVDKPLSQDALADFAEAAHAWDSDVSACRDALKSQRATRRQRTEELQAEQNKREEADRLAAAKAARREKMSAAERKLDQLQLQLENDQRFNIKDSTGVLRSLLTESVQLAVVEDDTHVIETTKALFVACCDFWGVNRKKNAKLKALWKTLNG